MGDTSDIVPTALTSSYIIQRHHENSVLLDSSELTAACNALGRYHEEENVYFSDDNIVEATKDLIRYLRKDGENHEVRRYFGQANIVEKNLIPLLKLYWEQTELFDILLRLLGNLTSPVLLLFEEEIPKDKTSRLYFLEILQHLQIHKQCFVDSQVWACLTTRLQQLLNIPQPERGAENELIIERILILVRNVLSVPADVNDEKRADNDVSVQDRLLWILDECGFMAILHYMVSSDQEEAYYMYLLEILSHMLRDHRAQDLALMSDIRSESERVQDEKEFDYIRKRELKKRNERMKNYTSARHSRFGGTFIFQNMKSVNDSQELIFHKKLSTAESLDFDINKSASRVASNRRPIKEADWKRRSPFGTRLQLKSFCIEFLNSGYNRLMHDVRGKLVRGKTMENDETYYLWALRFFMEFNRYYKFNIKLVSETLGREIFHYIQQKLENYFDMIISDKKKFYLWSKRLHLAILAYKELLYNINTMDKSPVEAIRENSKIIKSNIFYVIEYREFILTLLAAYDDKKMSDAYLIDLIETQHIFLKLLEAYCGKSSVVVQQVKKVRKKKKKAQTESAPTVSFEEALELKWDELASQLSTVMEGGENIPTIPPFDATSDVPIDEQRKDAMIKIQDFLRDGEVENAIGLLRSARDVWPDNDSFGSSSMTPEEEFLAIREIFFARLRDNEEMPAQHPAPEEEEEEDEEDEEDGALAVEKEVDFQFMDFVKRFAQPKIIAACGLALRQFDSNAPQTNHCILKLMHRVAFDCKMPAMLFQASIFRTFQRIFAESDQSQHKELVKFAIYIIRQFVKVAEKNKKIFMELLFWKNAKDAFDAEEGYGSYESSTKAMKKAWTEEQENELRVLVMEHKERGIEEGLVDWLSNNLIDNTKSHIQIARKLKELNLVPSEGLRKKKGSTRPPQEWSEAEVTQLEELYNQFSDAMDPLGCITERLDVKRPKARVKQKILELGLADNKALRKKRATKSRGQHEEGLHITSREFIESEDDSNSNSSGDEENQNRSNIPSKPKPQKKTKTLQTREKRSNAKKPVKTKKMELPALKKLVLEIIEKGMTESLKWISESLVETAEDQEQDINLDGDEGIPLVAINENDMHAIQSPVFEKFLLGIGILKPANEQEKFWRIPGNMPAAELKHHANFIDELVEKGAEAFPDYNEPPPLQTQAESSDDEDVFDRIRNFMHKPSTQENDNQIDTNLEQSQNDTLTEHDSQNGISQKSKKSKRITMLNDSDESETENTQDRNEEENNIEDTFVEYDLQNGMMTQNSDTSFKKTKKSKRITMLNDSESETENIGNENEEQNNVEDTFVEYDLQNGMMTQNSDNSVKKTKKSKRITMLDDSDESETENNENNKDNNLIEHEIQNSNTSIKKSKSKRISVLNDSDESEEETNKDEIDEVDLQISQNSERKLIIDESDESNPTPTQNKNEEMDLSASKKKTKRLQMLDDSDESENETANNESASKRTRESDSESNSHSIKRKKLSVIDSDED